MSYNIKVVTSDPFLKSVKRLSKKYRSLKNDLAELGVELRANPEMGIDLGDNLRKIRLAIKSKGRGKSGGVSVMSSVLCRKSCRKFC